VIRVAAETTTEPAPEQDHQSPAEFSRGGGSLFARNMSVDVLAYRIQWKWEDKGMRKRLKLADDNKLDDSGLVDLIEDLGSTMITASDR
jgi:hypothetical protein